VFDWKPEIRRRLTNLRLEPTREAAIIEELAQYLDDCQAARVKQTPINKRWLN
jgi:hypothetical protein